MERVIKSKIILVGLHRWPQAPEHRKYLRVPHRHHFHITATAQVVHNERDIEFHDLKDTIADLFPDSMKNGLIDFGTQSCESIAEFVLKSVDGLIQVEVSEDEECSAIISINESNKVEVSENPDKRFGLKFVTLCGSTKFREEYEMAEFLLEKYGFAVLSVGGYMHASQISLSEDKKRAADALHKAKIEASNCILVLNRHGYVGESTESEILHAANLNIPIFLLEGYLLKINGQLISGTTNVTGIHPEVKGDIDFWDGKKRFPFILRQSLHKFALDMEAKLTQEDLKKGHNGWEKRAISPDLFNRLREEEDELLLAIADDQGLQTSEDVKGEAVDVANFAMMIYDNIGRKPEKKTKRRC